MSRLDSVLYLRAKASEARDLRESIAQRVSSAKGATAVEAAFIGLSSTHGGHMAALHEALYECTAALIEELREHRGGD